MELRTGENLRKNYWYPNPTEKIAVDFLKDKDTCSYKVEKGELPGQYAIKVLGKGELKKKVTVKATAFSASAKEKIEKIGGKAEVI